MSKELVEIEESNDEGKLNIEVQSKDVQNIFPSSNVLSPTSEDPFYPSKLSKNPQSQSSFGGQHGICGKFTSDHIISGMGTSDESKASSERRRGDIGKHSVKLSSSSTEKEHKI
jgi:hypothetical protein